MSGTRGRVAGFDTLCEVLVPRESLEWLQSSTLALPSMPCYDPPIVEILGRLILSVNRDSHMPSDEVYDYKNVDIVYVRMEDAVALTGTVQPASERTRDFQEASLLD